MMMSLSLQKKLYTYNAHPKIRNKMEQMYHQFGTQSAQVEILNQSINKIEITDIERIRFIKLKKILGFTNSDSEEYAQYDHADYICTALLHKPSLEGLFSHIISK